jgi:hypothetical protein
MTREDMRTSPTSCAPRLKRKSRRSFRRWPCRVSAYARKRLHGSARLATASLGCTAGWIAGRSTIVTRHIARRRAEIGFGGKRSSVVKKIQKMIFRKKESVL